MLRLTGKPVFKGTASGPALTTQTAINFTASFTKIKNLLPFWRSQFQDRHHEFYQKTAKDTVLVFPAVIGSTYTGMVLLELITSRCAPAAMIVQNADSLLVSGPVLGDTWFSRSFPIVEYPDTDIYNHISDDDTVWVNGDTGEINIKRRMDYS